MAASDAVSGLRVWRVVSSCGEKEVEAAMCGWLPELVVWLGCCAILVWFGGAMARAVGVGLVS